MIESLRKAFGEHAFQVADIVARYGADRSALLEIPGLGPKTVDAFLAGLEAAAAIKGYPANARVTTPDDVVGIVGTRLANLRQEVFLALLLTTKLRLIDVVEVSMGSLNASIVHPRDLLAKAVKASAASIVLVHNHPSGDPMPSQQDVKLTKTIVDAAEVVGIDVVDHIVIGSEGSVSMRDMGILP